MLKAAAAGVDLQARSPQGHTALTWVLAGEEGSGVSVQAALNLLLAAEACSGSTAQWLAVTADGGGIPPLHAFVEATGRDRGPQARLARQLLTLGADIK